MAKFIKGGTLLKGNMDYIGESIEEMLRRVTTSGEPIEDSAPLIYTERKDGVQPQYDIRTDRFEIAQAAMDKVSATVQAQRDNKPSKEQPKTE